MDITRYIAFHHAKCGDIEITQKGEVVQDETEKGAIRLRIKIEMVK